MPITDVLTAPGRFGPLADDHPAVGRECAGCGQPLRAGDVPALVNGVPADQKDQAKADAGRPHTVSCELAHESCAREFLLLQR